MALGTEWFGLIGTGVGGLIGVVGTYGTQWSNVRAVREAREAQFDRDDHLRDIDRRREIYVRLSAILLNAKWVMFMHLAFHGNTPEMQERVKESFFAISGIMPEVQLSAPDSITPSLCSDSGDLRLRLPRQSNGSRSRP